jgi:hypothetical protein
MATSPAYFGNFGDVDQPTLNTVADYIAGARTILQDLVPDYRYDDPSLLLAFNVMLLEAKRLRADLFIWNLTVKGQAPAFQAVDDTYVSMEPQFRLALLHGIVGHALERDQEDYQDTRASAFLGLFTTGLIGRGLGPIGGGSPPQGRPH